jgi:general secretion pathway protein M
MNRWWQGLAVRERRVVAIGGTLVLVLLAWAFIWDPLSTSRARLEAGVTQAEADLAWMREAVPRLAARRAQGGSIGADRGGRSLPALADGSLRESGLGPHLARIEPLGEGRVGLWFDDVGFDPWIVWLEGFAPRYGVRVEELTVDRSVGTGMVDARVVLVDSRSGP